MSKIKSIKELEKLREELKKGDPSAAGSGGTAEQVQVKIAMATCSKAAGADRIMHFMSEELEKRGIDAIISETGCMGYCYAEPTIEVTLPGALPVVFGDVDLSRADQIIEKYIKQGEPVEGVIPVNYQKIEEI
ncbi:MAG: (2Fe-2S) ferredoxin domain-containing protein [Bacteroidales bacterium]